MNIPAVILCGGKGMRIRSEFPDLPKPLVVVHSKTILERVMEIYIHAGCREIFLCLGYKDKNIVEYFVGVVKMNEYETKGFISFEYGGALVNLVNTGLETNTAGRIKKLENYLKGHPYFYMTYADGITDVNIEDVFVAHINSNKIATLLAVKPKLSFGVLDIENGIVHNFNEKPKSNDWINGGFFVLKNEIFEYLDEDDVWELDTVKKLIDVQQLNAYQYDGLWMCMDNYKDYIEMTDFYRRNEVNELR